MRYDEGQFGVLPEIDGFSIEGVEIFFHSGCLKECGEIVQILRDGCLFRVQLGGRAKFQSPFSHASRQEELHDAMRLGSI